MKKLEWKTEQRKVNDLLPLDINPRKITDDKRQRLIASLEKFNLAEIPAINKDNTVIAGNQRLKALQIAGRGDEFIDVRVPNRNLTAAEIKEYAVISNTHAGEFDLDILNEHFSDIDLTDIGLNLGEMKFMESDLFEKSLQRFEDIEKNKTIEAKEDDYEIPDEIKTDIVTGDLFEIGEHRLLCGDSTNADNVAKLMNGEKADMVFTDPPYGVSIGKKNKMLNSFHFSGRNLTDIQGDDLNQKELYGMLLLAFCNLKQNLEDHASVYVTAPQGGSLGLMMMMMKDALLEVKHVLNWVKNAPTFSMGRLDYEYKHEPILYTWNKKHIFYGLGEFKNSIWLFDKPRSNKEHPTMKPVLLVTNAMQNSSKIGDIVSDIYLGSGTTMVAAHQLKRKCYGMEIDPNYCQVIIDRMLKLDPSLTIKRNGVVWNTPTNELASQPAV